MRLELSVSHFCYHTGHVLEESKTQAERLLSKRSQGNWFAEDSDTEGGQKWTDLCSILGCKINWHHEK